MNQPLHFVWTNISLRNLCCSEHHKRDSAVILAKPTRKSVISKSVSTWRGRAEGAGSGGRRLKQIDEQREAGKPKAALDFAYLICFSKTLSNSAILWHDEELQSLRLPPSFLLYLSLSIGHINRSYNGK